MRFTVPSRDLVQADVFTRPPLRDWAEFSDLLHGPVWPSVADIEQRRQQAILTDHIYRPRICAQNPTLLADGFHYEMRIAEAGILATREHNWHDLLNALIWLRHPELKTALNARQVADIQNVGPKTRTRGQCALTHFDEGGVIVWLADPALLKLWDAHDGQGLFWRERAAWGQRIGVTVFGHALLEHALSADPSPLGKALVVMVSPQWMEPHTAPTNPSILRYAEGESALATAIRDSKLLNDPQELRPLPLAGIPGWHANGEQADFYQTAPSFRPLRPGRRYPEAFSLARA